MILGNVFQKYPNDLGMEVSVSRMMQYLTFSNLFKLLAGMRDHLVTSFSSQGSTTTVSNSAAVQKPLSGTSAWKWDRERRLYCRTSEHNYQTKITHNSGHKCRSIQVALDSWCPEHHFTMTQMLSLLLPAPTVLLVAWVCPAEHSPPVCWPTLLSFCPFYCPFPQGGPVVPACRFPSSTVLEKQEAACASSGQQYPSCCPARCQRIADLPWMEV